MFFQGVKGLRCDYFLSLCMQTLSIENEGLIGFFFETISEVFRDIFTDFVPESNLWAVTSYFEFIED